MILSSLICLINDCAVVPSKDKREVSVDFKSNQCDERQSSLKVSCLYIDRIHKLKLRDKKTET